MDNRASESSLKAIFNIGAVTRMTGIPSATLHAWERRYGFPSSLVRTQGGHRLYSEKDVSFLRYVRAQIEQGISTRQAVAAVQKMDIEGRLPGDHFINPPMPLELLPASLSGRVQIAEALFQHELDRADRIIKEMLSHSTPEEITLNFIGPVLSDLGQAWVEGRIKVADEHLASNYLYQYLRMWMASGPPTRNTSPIVLACAPGDLHEGSLLMLGVLLRRRAWPVTYLGQNVPFPDLAAFVEQIQPQAMVLVGMLPETAHSLAEWPKWIRQTTGRPLVTFAGRAFVIYPEIKEHVPGIYLGDQLQSGVARLEQLLR
jgi:MerR family transcriptional regulator, light-induced transcriptional regulator